MADLLSDEDRRLLDKAPEPDRTELGPDNVPVVEDLVIAIRRFLEAGAPGVPAVTELAVRGIDRTLDRALGRWAG